MERVRLEDGGAGFAADRRTLFDRYLKYCIRRDIRLGSGAKIGILIARLSDDTPSNSCRTTLFDTIRDELGSAVELTNWPQEFALSDGHELDVERGVYERAQNSSKIIIATY